MFFRQALLVASLTFIFGGMVMAETIDSMAIGPRFHHETAFDDNGIKGQMIAFGQPEVLYKRYDQAPRIKLPAPSPDSTPLFAAMERRRSIRNFTAELVPFHDLARIIMAADGITHSRQGFAMRTAPSGGALYPIEIYLYAHQVDSLERGWYHFSPADSSLEFILPGDFREELYKASHEQSSVGNAPAALVLTACFNRSTKKYADRGYRYTYMESGSICQNIYLAAEALKLGTVAVGAFNDDRLNALLDIDGIREAALLIMPIGRPAE